MAFTTKETTARLREREKNREQHARVDISWPVQEWLMHDMEFKALDDSTDHYEWGRATERALEWARKTWMATNR